MSGSLSEVLEYFVEESFSEEVESATILSEKSRKRDDPGSRSKTILWFVVEARRSFGLVEESETILWLVEANKTILWLVEESETILWFGRSKQDNPLVGTRKRDNPCSRRSTAANRKPRKRSEKKSQLWWGDPHLYIRSTMKHIGQDHSPNS